MMPRVYHWCSIISMIGDLFLLIIIITHILWFSYKLAFIIIGQKAFFVSFHFKSFVVFQTDALSHSRHSLVPFRCSEICMLKVILVRWLSVDNVPFNCALKTNDDDDDDNDDDDDDRHWVRFVWRIVAASPFVRCFCIYRQSANTIETARHTRPIWCWWYCANECDVISFRLCSQSFFSLPYFTLLYTKWQMCRHRFVGVMCKV